MSVRQKIIVAFTTRLGLQPDTAKAVANHLSIDLMEQIILEVEKDQFTEDSINRELTERPYTCVFCNRNFKNGRCPSCGATIEA